MPMKCGTVTYTAVKPYNPSRTLIFSGKDLETNIYFSMTYLASNGSRFSYNICIDYLHNIITLNILLKPSYWVHAGIVVDFVLETISVRILLSDPTVIHIACLKLLQGMHRAEGNKNWYKDFIACSIHPTFLTTRY